MGGKARSPKVPKKRSCVAHHAGSSAGASGGATAVAVATASCSHQVLLGGRRTQRANCASASALERPHVA